MNIALLILAAIIPSQQAPPPLSPVPKATDEYGQPIRTFEELKAERGGPDYYMNSPLPNKKSSGWYTYTVPSQTYIYKGPEQTYYWQAPVHYAPQVYVSRNLVTLPDGSTAYMSGGNRRRMEKYIRRGQPFYIQSW